MFPPFWSWANKFGDGKEKKRRKKKKKEYCHHKSSPTVAPERKYESVGKGVGLEK